MKTNATFNTAFIALDKKDIDSFLDASFRSLRRKVDEVIKSPGTHSLILDIVSDHFVQAKSQEIKLEEVA